MTQFRSLILIAALLAIATTTAATPQTVPDVTNPSAIVFTPSTDHALLDSYELDILRPDGSVLQTINVGKPAIVNAECTAPVNVQPIAFASGYSMRLRAKAGTAFSPYTVSVNKFDRAPGGPSKLIAK